MAASSMSQKTLEGVFLRKRHALDFIESAWENPDSPESLLAVIDGLKACLTLRDYLRKSCQLNFDDAFNNRVSDYQTSGKMLLAAFDAALMAFEAVNKRIHEADNDGWTQEHCEQFGLALEAFKKAVTDVTELKKDFQAQWPWMDIGMLNQSIANEPRGQRRPARAVFDELRNRDR